MQAIGSLTGSQLPRIAYMPTRRGSLISGVPKGNPYDSESGAAL